MKRKDEEMKNDHVAVSKIIYLRHPRAIETAIAPQKRPNCNFLLLVINRS